jgi:hypothetical protein
MAHSISLPFELEKDRQWKQPRARLDFACGIAWNHTSLVDVKDPLPRSNCHRHHQRHAYPTRTYILFILARCGYIVGWTAAFPRQPRACTTEASSTPRLPMQCLNFGGLGINLLHPGTAHPGMDSGVEKPMLPGVIALSGTIECQASSVNTGREHRGPSLASQGRIPRTEHKLYR